MTEQPINDGRDGRGRFAPGNRFGGSSRTGSRPGAVLALDALAQEVAEDVVRAVLDRARSGDMAAAEVVLRRIWPVRRGRPVQVEMPELREAGDLVVALGAIAGAVAAGELTAEEGQAFASVVEGQRRAIETLNLEQRIAALEARSPT